MPAKTAPAAPQINALEVAWNYAKGVVNHEIVAGKLVQSAAKRFLADWAQGPKRGLKFEPEKAQRAVNFFGFLNHSKGEWGGQPFELAPWQVFIIANLFGWHKADGTRRFNEAYIEVARKNGKTTLLAGIGLYLLVMDTEPGAEIYCAATTKEQARLCFAEAARMRQASPFLAKRVKAYGQKFCNNMNVAATNSKFEPVSSESETLDGLNSHGLLIDELHAHPDRKLYDVLRESIKSRRQPMVVSITTAGFDRSDSSICWNLHRFAEKVVEGVISKGSDNFAGDNFFAFIACIDEGDDWADEKNWPKANPNINVSVKVDGAGLRQEATRAKEDPTALNSFLRKSLNVWTSQDIRWMPADKWEVCCAAGRNSDPKKMREEALVKLAGRRCFGGLDLSSKNDITSYYLVFPPTAIDKFWNVLGWNWVPELCVPERVKKDRVNYDVWIREGYLFKTSGNIVDQDVIREQVLATKKLFQLDQVGYDSWNNTQLAIQLEAAGVKVVETRQGYKTFSEPMKELMALTLQKKLEHWNDPILSWAMSNVEATMDPAGNIKPDKDKAKEKIDPAVATLMAFARAVSTNLVVNNPYANRGILLI